MDKIATKSTFMIGIRIAVIIMVTAFVIYPIETSLILYVRILSIIYGLYYLVKLVYQLCQPKVLISKDYDTLIIHRFRKDIKVVLADISGLISKASRTRGVDHDYGTLEIVLLDGKIIKIHNCDKVELVKTNIEKLKNLHK